jgi:hypothetical protein
MIHIDENDAFGNGDAWEKIKTVTNIMLPYQIKPIRMKLVI